MLCLGSGLGPRPGFRLSLRRGIWLSLRLEFPVQSEAMTRVRAETAIRVQRWWGPFRSVHRAAFLSVKPPGCHLLYGHASLSSLERAPQPSHGTLWAGPPSLRPRPGMRGASSGCLILGVAGPDCGLSEPWEQIWSPVGPASSTAWQTGCSETRVQSPVSTEHPWASRDLGSGEGFT